MEAIRDLKPRYAGNRADKSRDNIRREAGSRDTVVIAVNAHGCSIERAWPRVDDTNARDGDDAVDGDGAPDGVRNVLSVAAYQLLARARQLSAGQPTDRQMAMIFGISACEMHTEQALTRLLKNKGSKLRDISALVNHPISLDNPHVQKVYTALTHDAPWGIPTLDQPPVRWWQDWLTSRQLKQDVGRDARAVSHSQAALCIKTAVSYFSHVSEAVANGLGESYTREIRHQHGAA